MSKTGKLKTAVPKPDPIHSINDPRLAFITNKWSRTVLQPLLIATLITSLITAVLVLTEIFTETTGWLPLALFIFFATLEGCYTTLWLQQPERRLLNHTAYRAAELLLLALLLRLFGWVFFGGWPSWAALPLILRSPQVLILDPAFIWGGVLSFVAWGRAIRLGQTFTDLAIDQAEVHYYTQPLGHRNASDKPVRTNRGEIVLSFLRQWMGGAMILAIVTSMSSFDLANYSGDFPFTIARLGLRPELLLFLILYFLSGLTLLSQARLAALNARWLINGVRRGGQVEQNWHRYTLWLLGGLALMAAFLPLGSTFAISNLLQALIVALSAVFSFLFTLFSSLLALILSLFSSGAGPAEVAEPLPQPTLPPVPTVTPTPIPSALPPPVVDSGLILSSLFWAVAIVMSVMAINFFMHERGLKVNTAVFQSIWQRILQWLQITWHEAGSQVQDWQQAVRTRLQRKPKENESNKPTWRFVRLNALSPREQIRYFYLSTVKRASDRGVRRQDAETPLEFAQDLKESWPEAEEDVDALTNAFLEARYGRSPIDKKDVSPVKKRWQQVKSSLRRRASPPH